MYIYGILILVIVGVIVWIAIQTYNSIANPEKGVTNCDKRISEISKVKTRKMYSNFER